MAKKLILPIISMIISVTGLVIIFFKYDIGFQITPLLIGCFGVFTGFLLALTFVKIREKKPSLNVILAYTFSDREIGDEFAQSLEKYRIKVLSETERLGNDKFEIENQEIRNAQYVLVLISEHSRKSHYIDRIISLSKSNSKRIIPIVLDQAEVPKSISKYPIFFNHKEKNLDENTHDLADQLIHAI